MAPWRSREKSEIQIYRHSRALKRQFHRIPSFRNPVWLLTDLETLRRQVACDRFCLIRLGPCLDLTRRTASAPLGNGPPREISDLGVQGTMRNTRNQLEATVGGWSEE